jgi:hypothetical protein
VDFIGHSIENGTLFFSVAFKDKTNFPLRSAPVVLCRADLGGVKTGDLKIIRESMKRILR